MIRGYVIYVAMFVALGVGLWAVFRAGATLRAPGNIAGEWDVLWETGSPTGMGYHGTMRVEQSGRYCTFEFDRTRTISLKMIDGIALGGNDPNGPLARLRGEGYDMTLHPTAERHAVRLEISGRDAHRGVAERVGRSGEGEAAATSPPPTLDPVADARP